MKDKFTDLLRAQLSRQLEKLYLPKLPKAHLSRIVMYETINASADSGYEVRYLQVKETTLSDFPGIIVIVNEEIRLDFKYRVIEKEKEVKHA